MKLWPQTHNETWKEQLEHARPPLLQHNNVSINTNGSGLPNQISIANHLSGLTIFICKTRTFGVCPHTCPLPAHRPGLSCTLLHCLCWPSLMGSGCMCSAHHNSGHNTQIPQKQCSSRAHRASSASVERGVVGGHLPAGTFAAVGRIPLGTLIHNVFPDEKRLLHCWRCSGIR